MGVGVSVWKDLLFFVQTPRRGHVFFEKSFAFEKNCALTLTVTITQQPNQKPFRFPPVNSALFQKQITSHRESKKPPVIGVPETKLLRPLPWALLVVVVPAGISCS